MEFMNQHSGWSLNSIAKPLMFTKAFAPEETIG